MPRLGPGRGGAVVAQGLGNGMEQADRRLRGSFALADDIAAAAAAGALGGAGPIAISPSGLIGPLFEIVRVRRIHPDQFSAIAFASPAAAAIDAALSRGSPSGLGRRDRLGVFPLALLDAEGQPTEDWQLWCMRADQAAKHAGFPDSTAAAIIGALGELVDNVFRHSGAPATGLAGFAARPGTFEVVIGDGGAGVLETLRQNPDHASLPDAGAALRLAVTDGESRFGRDSGSGFGMGQMFRALASHDGHLRFRSGDHALEVTGHSPSLQGRVELGHKASLPGLTVSVLCRTAAADCPI